MECQPWVTIIIGSVCFALGFLQGRAIYRWTWADPPHPLARKSRGMPITVPGLIKSYTHRFRCPHCGCEGVFVSDSNGPFQAPFVKCPQKGCEKHANILQGDDK